jgi:hypothetical protein
MKSLFLLLLSLPLFTAGQIRHIVAQHPIDEPTVENLNDGIRGRWKFVEDTNKKNFYEIIRGNPYAEDRYHIKFWDRGGTNPTWESNMHFSKIGNTQFINVPYFEDNFTHVGYFFLKILDINADYTKITAALVHDTNLWNLNQAGVKQRITSNVNNPNYYSDTVHFYKMK